MARLLFFLSIMRPFFLFILSLSVHYAVSSNYYDVRESLDDDLRESLDDDVRESLDAYPSVRIPKDELEIMRRVFGYWDTRNTVFKDILTYGTVPDYSYILSSLKESNLLPVYLFTDPDFLSKVRALSNQKEKSSNNFDDYEKCKEDYSAYIDPITNRLYNLGRSIYCSRQNLTNAECSLIDMAPVVPLPSWGIRFLDAHGKIPEGISELKLHWVGGHDLCHDLKVKRTINETGEEREFEGKYCRLSLTPKFFDSRNFSLSLLYGVCVPDHCKTQHVERYIYDNIVLSYLLNETLNMKITKVYCGQEDLERSTDSYFKLAIGIIGSIVILMIIGTLYDGLIRPYLINKHIPNTDSFLDKKISIKHRLDLFIVAFSVYSNIGRIFNVTRRKGDELRSINGVRYLTFAWLTLGNTYIYGPVYTESWLASNVLTVVRTYPREFLFQFIVNYHLNTDVFLLISGILVTWTWLNLIKDLSVWFVIRHIVRRYWRLAPAMMLVLMFYTCLYRYFIEGPLYPSDIGDAKNCRTNWWVNALMVHNLFEKHNICLSWMFMVPLVFQLHVAALVVLIPLVKKPKIGYLMLALAFCGYIAGTAVISHRIRSERDVVGLVADYLMVPWCRAGSYIVGMTYGIILYKTKRRLSIHPILSLIGWIISLGTIIAVIFSTYSQFKERGGLWSVSQSVVYDTLARPALAVAVGWIIFVSETGNSLGASKFLGWYLFRPMSKLVYPSILVSSLMMYRYIYGSRQLFYIEKFQMFYLFIADLFYVALMGSIFGLLFHFNVSLGLERVLSINTIKQWVKGGHHPNNYFKASTAPPQHSSTYKVKDN